MNSYFVHKYVRSGFCKCFNFSWNSIGLYQASKSGLVNEEIKYWNKYWQQFCSLAIFNKSDPLEEGGEGGEELQNTVEFGQVVQKLRDFYISPTQK